MKHHPSSGGATPPSTNPGARTAPDSTFLFSFPLPLRPAARASDPPADGAAAFGSGLGASGGGAPASDPPAGEAGEGKADGGRKKTKTRRRTRRRSSSGDAGEAEPRAESSRAESSPSAEADAPAETSEGGEGAPAKKRSRRRGGRGRRRSGEAEGEAEGGEAAPAEEAQSAEEAEVAARPRRARRVRGKRASEAKGEAEPEARAEEGGADESGSGEAGDDEGGGKKRRKRGTRGGRRRRKAASAVGVETIPGEDDELPELVDLPPEADLVREGEAEESGGTKKRGRKAAKKKTAKREKKASKKATKKRSRRGKAKEEDEDEEDAEPAEAKHRHILVNAGDPEETRVAVIEDGRIVDLQMTVKKHVSFVSDIYRGRVVNLEPAIGAAFVDFGQGRNGFLHASDVLPSYGDSDWNLEKLLSTPVEAEEDDDESEGDDEDGAAAEDAAEEEPEAPKKRGGRGRRSKGRTRRPRLPIDKLLKKGQMVVVQITKDAIGDKGPTLTTYVSIPGRYLVLMPSLERTGVSRKIDDEKERRRLKRILSSLEIPDGMGVIVRTAGVGKTKADIKRDLEYLLLAWEDFSKRLKSGRNPAPLYQESDAAVRTMRDLYTSGTEVVIVDSEEVHQRMVDFTTRLMPEHVERIKEHDGPRPLFHSHGVEQDFEKIFARRVELPSGGSIVIDQTEALVAIDVNSGRTRSEGAEFEDIALKTNLEAAPEIARQIKLRDLGGIIVLDYIDMMRAGSRRAVEKATRDALKTDRARSKIGRISQFGLLELTRQRLGPGLSKLVYDTCSRCRGSGRRRNASSRAQAILRRLGAALSLKGFSSVEVRAHPEVIDYLKDHLQSHLDRLEEKSGRKLILQSVPDQVEDSVLHYLRADGREVRPGGRRRR